MVKGRLQRWATHALTTPMSLRRAFPPATLAELRAAISAAEAGHGGEIRFVIESALPWAHLRRNAPVRHRALELFSRLRVWDTEHNNGVLIYVGLADRAVEILADRGVANRVPEATWDAICSRMRDRFRAGDFEQGAVAAVGEVGALLKQLFPLAPGETRHNELPDRPIVL
ncbi:MAG TPA: TPM domain-containing protein [Burkholderiaceae bacterium]|nr:TPM domain-containing protein [Burkholderiaceae bacterium]